MKMVDRTYICIDLKSFYASVECVERGLDPLKTHLVVADASRTEKTICLAVSPSLKAYGIPGRARLFEVNQKIAEINNERRSLSSDVKLIGKSYDADELKRDKNKELSIIVAPPRMQKYLEISTKIYDIYLKYIAAEDIHVYSIDEVFIDVTTYLKPLKMTAYDLAKMLIYEVLNNTGITATAGIGTNMYLAKVAMDIEAKHIAADDKGVRIAYLDEMLYRQKLWEHKPLTDFWRVGAGTVRRLNKLGLYTMGDIARCSIGSYSSRYNEDLLYKEFGINAELLIDHSWGWEPARMEDVKRYKPSVNSLSSGQVLHEPYNNQKALLILKEMIDSLSLDLIEKKVVTNQLVLSIGYDKDNLVDLKIANKYKGEIVVDHYGRSVPKSAHGSINIENYTASSKILTKHIVALYKEISDPLLLVRRITIAANNVISEENIPKKKEYVQLDMFNDYANEREEEAINNELQIKEKNVLKSILKIKKKYGKNAVLKGMNFDEGATMRDRNNQIGGHKA